jgi:hypothetical protein
MSNWAQTGKIEDGARTFNSDRRGQCFAEEFWQRSFEKV